MNTVQLLASSHCFQREKEEREWWHVSSANVPDVDVPTCQSQDLDESQEQKPQKRPFNKKG
jgi:hypothetical protein